MAGNDGAMVERVELHRVALRLREPVRTAYGTEDHRDVVLAHVYTDEGEGWGECGALPEPTYGSEYVTGALDVLERHLAPRLFGTPVVDGEITAHVRDVVGHPFAKSALAMATLDAHLRATRTSLARHLGAARTHVTAGVTLGIDADLGRLWETTIAAVDAGYRNVKLKIRPGWDLQPIEVVRKVDGVEHLTVDANGSYRIDHVEALKALDRAPVDAIEQPTGTDALDAHAELTQLLDTPVGLDEDVTSFGTIRLVAHLGAADAVAVKPGRFGSLAAAHLAARLARDLDLHCWLGGMYETGIGRAAHLALAACVEFDRPVDWSASNRYWAQDVVEQPHVLLDDGTIAVPDGPGLGVTPDVTWIEMQTIEKRVVLARS